MKQRLCSIAIAIASVTLLVSPWNMQGNQGGALPKKLRQPIDIPDGHQAVGFPIVSSTLPCRPDALVGRRVDVILKIVAQDGSTVEKLLLANVLVLDCGCALSRGPSTHQVITFAMSEADALKASLARHDGECHIQITLWDRVSNAFQAWTK